MSFRADGSTQPGEGLGVTSFGPSSSRPENYLVLVRYKVYPGWLHWKLSYVALSDLLVLHTFLLLQPPELWLCWDFTETFHLIDHHCRLHMPSLWKALAAVTIPYIYSSALLSNCNIRERHWNCIALFRKYASSSSSQILHWPPCHRTSWSDGLCCFVLHNRFRVRIMVHTGLSRMRTPVIFLTSHSPTLG
jgi:hypothetical protein